MPGNIVGMLARLCGRRRATCGSGCVIGAVLVAVVGGGVLEEAVAKGWLGSPSGTKDTLQMGTTIPVEGSMVELDVDAGGHSSMVPVGVFQLDGGHAVLVVCVCPLRLRWGLALGRHALCPVHAGQGTR